MKIHKYKLCDVPPDVKDGPQPHEFMLPEGSEFLHLSWQGSAVYMWFACNPDREDVLRKFVIIPTGADFEWGRQPSPSYSRWYIASTVHPSLGCVAHVFGEFSEL